MENLSEFEFLIVESAHICNMYKSIYNSSVKIDL